MRKSSLVGFYRISLLQLLVAAQTVFVEKNFYQAVLKKLYKIYRKTSLMESFFRETGDLQPTSVVKKTTCYEDAQPEPPQTSTLESFGTVKQ